MALIHMDIEAVQSTQAGMKLSKEVIQENLNSLSNHISQTVGTNWIGNSANEFQQSFDQLRSSLIQQLDALEQLSRALQTEISQWQEMSAHMG